MTKRQKDRINRCGKLRSRGWKVNHNDLNTVEPHSGFETTRHFLVKAEICRQLSNQNHSFATEVHHPERGQCDVLDLNESEDVAYIYEVETNATKERRREKAMQYTNDAQCDLIADCRVVDPTEAPDSLDALADWAEDKLF